MQRQLDRIIDMTEGLVSPLIATSRMGVDPPDCSITECMSLLKCLDGGPSLSMISSSIKSKGKLKDVIGEALDEDQGRGLRTVGCTVVQWPVCHPGCTPSKLPGFVVQIS